MRKLNYEFQNHVIKNEKKNGNVSYTLTDYTHEQALFTINLSQSAKDWRLNFSINGKAKSRKSLSYVDQKGNKETISPNQYPLAQRTYYFEQIVDILFTCFNNGSIYEMVGDIEPNHVFTLNEVSIDYYKHIQQSMRKKSYQTYKSKVDIFLSLYGSNTLAEFNAIPKKDIHYSFYELHTAKDWSERTKYAYKTLLYHFFTFLNENIEAYNYNEKIVNHLETIKIKKGLNSQKKFNKIYTDNDFYLIMSESEKNPKTQLLNLMFRIMYDTHLRTNETRQMPIKNINFTGNFIELEEYKMKTKTSRKSPVHYSIIERIKQLILDTGLTIDEAKELYLFGSNNSFLKTNPCGQNHFIKNFIEYIREPFNLDIYYGAYSMKHYANVRKYKEGATIAELQKINGHASISMTEIYLRELSDYIEIVNVPLGIPTQNPKGNTIQFTPTQNTISQQIQ